MSLLQREISDVLNSLQRNRDIHLQWVNHLEHCASCPDCASNVVAQVGDLETHRGHIVRYDRVIALIYSLAMRVRP